LAALRQVSLAVRQMPTLRAPRDFRLDPAVYGPRPQRQWLRLYQWSSAFSAAAALIVFALGLFGVLNQTMVVPADRAAYQAADAITLTEETREIALLPTLPVIPVTEMPPVLGRSAEAEIAQESASAAIAAAPEMLAATTPPGEAVGVGGGSGEEGATGRVTADPAELAAAIATANALEMAPAADAAGAPVGMGGGLSPTEEAAEMLNEAAEIAAMPAQTMEGADEGQAALDDLRDGEAVEAPGEDDSWKMAPGIVIPATGTPALAGEFFAQEQEAPVNAPVVVDFAGVDPVIFIGAGFVLLVLAVLLFAVSRRMRR